MKPVIRIRLEENTYYEPLLKQYYRKQGSDVWVVTVTLTSSEGHVTYQSFSENQKDHALGQAYGWLEKYYRAKWYYPWAVEQWNKYQDMLDKDCDVASHFSDNMDLVESGRFTPEAFTSKWENHYSFHLNLVNKGKTLKKDRKSVV